MGGEERGAVPCARPGLEAGRARVRRRAPRPGESKRLFFALSLPSLHPPLPSLPRPHPATHRYDHHQKEFQDGFGHGFTTRLSSAGLVYKHFGREVVKGLLAADTHPAAPPQPLDDATVDAVYLATYRSFMEAVDAIDNGVNRFPGAVGPPAYASSTDLAARVGGLNPAWNDPDQGDGATNAGFAEAVAMTGEAFEDAVLYNARHWLPARNIVAAAVAGRHAVDPSGAVIELSHFCPWKSHLYEMEAEDAALAASPVKFCIFQDDREGAWRVQCLPDCPGSFKNRLSLPAPLCGLRGEALDAAGAAGIAGVTPPPGGVFIHVSGFTGGHASREGALAYARAALAAEAEAGAAAK